MKLYSYSNELLTFVETKWINVKFVFGGILMVTIVLVGAIKLNQSVGFTIWSRSERTLAAENNFLRQQVSLISPRVNKLEMQAAKLNERANNLHRLLYSDRIARDTILRFLDATNKFKRQSLVLAATSYRR